MNIDKYSDLLKINSMGVRLEIKEQNGVKKKKMIPSTHYRLNNIDWCANQLWWREYDENRFKKHGCSNLEEQVEYLRKKRTLFEHRGIDTRVYFHIDVDIHDDEIDLIPQDWWDFIEDLKKTTDYYASTTKKRGFHFIITVEGFKDHLKHRGNSFDTHYNLKTVLNDDKYKSHIEILSGTWGFCPANTKVVINGIRNITEEDFRKIIIPKDQKTSNDKNVVKREKTHKKVIELDRKDMTRSQLMYLELADIIKLKHIKEYHTWTRLVWSLANAECHSYSIAKAMSQRTDNYDEDVFNKLWQNSKTGCTIGTFLHYAKESNIQKYNEIRAKYFQDYDVLNDDDSLAKIYIEGNLQSHVFENKEKGKLYTWRHSCWREEGDTHELIKLCIPEAILGFAVELKKKINAEQCEIADKEDNYIYDLLIDRNKKVDKLIRCIKSTSKINSVEARVRHYLADCKNKVDFDYQPELFAFDNCVFDLRIGQTVEVKKEDYILTTTGYDYEECAEASVDELKRILRTILPDTDKYKTYIHHLCLGLTGFNSESLVFAIGNGRNGKGVINELQETLIGNYFYTAPSSLLLNNQKLGGCPEIANMNNKRMVVFREPAEGKKINMALVKELTGGNKINSRALFSNNTTIWLKAAWFLEANHFPAIEGDKTSDQACNVDRAILIDFLSTFTDDDNDLKCEGFYRKNADFKTLIWREKMRIPLFKILLEYMAEYKNETGKHVWEKLPKFDSIKKETMKYLESGDEMKLWLKDNLKTVEWKDESLMFARKEYITCKDIYTKFKISDIYNNMSKDDRRKHNESWFRRYVETTNPYRKKYRERYGNKKGQKRSVLFGYKIDWEDDESENDLDC